MFFRFIKNHIVLICFHKRYTFRDFPLHKLKYLPSCYSIFSFSKPEDDTEINRYWQFDEVSALLDEADRLYHEGNYLAVYEILNRLKYQDNVEVQWRICRVLYKMSSHEVKQKVVKENMILEAYCLIKKTVLINQNHAESYKWLAIITDYKSLLKGAFSRLKMAPVVHNQLQKSLELNPEDPTVLYMVGSWSYHISHLTWLKKLIAKLLFQCPEPVSLEDAFKYFQKAEQVKPRFFIGNLYMLGLCSYELGMFYRARYYLKIAAELPIHNDLEKQYSEQAKKLADELKNYEVDVHSLCH